MIYRPAGSRRLWDTWLFKWHDTYHLFYLESQETLWDHIGHAVSEDLVHWRPLVSVPVRGRAGEWNEGPALTGMVVHHDGRFYMFVGGCQDGVQVVGVYTSNDLDRWTPHPKNPVLRPQGPHYLCEPAPPQRPTVDWRDPCVIFREEDRCYHAFLCGRLPQWSHEHTGAAVAHVRSRDLLHWEHLPPVDAPVGRFYHTEVPDAFELDGRHYLLFSTVTLHGLRRNTPGRDDAVGTFYAISDRFEGPYVLPHDCLLIGAGSGHMVSYVGRTIPYQGGRLLYHHIQANSPSVASLIAAWGAPKMVRSRDDGSLYLQYLPILEQLETGTVFDAKGDLPRLEVRDLGDWQSQGARVLGEAGVVGSACKIGGDVADLHFACQVSIESGARAGVALRSAGSKGVLVTLDIERQRLEVGTASYDPLMGWGTDVGDMIAGTGPRVVRDTYRCRLHRNREYRLRCFARDQFFEIYLDDRWVSTSVLADAARAGDVELVVERGKAAFSELRLATIEPLA